MTDSTQPQRFLSFDFGMNWIGVAVGQSLTGTATPLEALKARDGIPNWQQIEQLVSEWKPDGFIVGLPLNMDGTMSDMGYAARKFKNRLQERFKIPAHSWDERLTSFEARGLLLEQDRNQRDFRKRQIDSLAAKLIFESWFENQGTPDNS